MLGKGTYAKVYKGVLWGVPIAIKVPNLEMILSYKDLNIYNHNKNSKDNFEEESSTDELIEQQDIKNKLLETTRELKKRAKQKDEGEEEEDQDKSKNSENAEEEDGEEENEGEGDDQESTGDQEENIREAYMERYQNALDELKMLRELNHPNICLLIGTCFVKQDEKKKLLLIYEMMDGDLNSTIKDLSIEPPSIVKRIKICYQIGSALGYVASKGIIHGDLKPTNILQTQNKHFKVTDFGLATWETRQDFEGGAPIW